MNPNPNPIPYNNNPNNQQNNYHPPPGQNNTNYANIQQQPSNLTSPHAMNNNLNNTPSSSSFMGFNYNNINNTNPNHNSQSQNTNPSNNTNNYNGGNNSYSSHNTPHAHSHSNYNTNNNNNNSNGNLHSQSRPNLMNQTMNDNTYNQQKKIKRKNMDDYKVETRFKWQWQDDFGQWNDFTTKDSNNMLSAIKGQAVYYEIGQFRYEFSCDHNDPTRGQQRNLSTNRIRVCRKISTTFSVHKGLTLKKMLDSSWNDKYPSWWFDKSAQLHDADVVDWPLDNEICVEIIDRFNQSGHGYEIKSIQSVQNKFLWKNYQFQRELHSEALGKSKLNEKYLFHGTDYDAAQNITVQGFLRDHGRVMAFGRGTYFAASASTSIGYSPQDTNGYQWMFLCAVILGESCSGSRAYQVPPTKPNSSVHYESMVDSTTHPQIFVISKDYQAYPLFLIKFTTDRSTAFGLGLLSLNINRNMANNGRKKKKKKKGNKSNQKSKSLIPIKTSQMNANSANASGNNNNSNPNQSSSKKRIVARSNNSNQSQPQASNNTNNPSMSGNATNITSHPFAFVSSLPPPTANNSLIVPTNLPILRPIILPIQSLSSASGFPMSLIQPATTIPPAPTITPQLHTPSLTSPHQPQTTLSTQNSSSSLVSQPNVMNSIVSVTNVPYNYTPMPPNPTTFLSSTSSSQQHLTLNPNTNPNVVTNMNVNNNRNVLSNNNNNNNNNNITTHKMGGFRLSAAPSTSTQIVSSNSNVDPFRQQSPLYSATTPQSSQLNVGGISSSSMVTVNSTQNQTQAVIPPHTPPTMSPTLQSLPMLSSAPLANFSLVNGDMYNS
eukprot:CAMPEP_0201574532 /NCGR_PEP_ID=MMETSP0190_2-20130828/19078_1 /ASSEMBLY_ACC=CAM_ASM_000263 /TAXON_ID=37353 /ORGANISM="Rosalina sp." /LENGTH=827 /DNA_ID=CAMNT_0048002891 /DNA_START=385 /DNA_END=2868 /DNA_ORIENTATION=-